ncbi:MAG: hypothetical protein K1060chlam3_00307, partial [Candidatus Anoxychlamydiales bacterium]|nr:hypothetical protein [Candidatus Anoxychlamydiales bacterium]
MNPDIFSLKEGLLLFRNKLTESIEREKEYPHDLNNDYPISPWQERESYSWIFFETGYRLFEIVSDQTRNKNWGKQYPKELLEPASMYRFKWLNKKTEKNGNTIIQPRLTESHKYEMYGIEKPDPSISLIDYIKHLRTSEDFEKSYKKKIWEESLGSFLEYVRAYTPVECHGFIDVIFPEDRTFFNNTIIRLVTNNKFPTNIVFVSEILKNLSERILNGDPRTQHASAETLALAWICLTSARLQVPI